ncbi:MAG: hypothetical protein KGR98_08545, partial [Verrucomicrobia bacterium]|nr:hypothetical protein [Verrucomicrobiota bacterium]
LEPLWNAWAPLLPIFSAAVIAIGLLLCWTVLAAVYFFPVRLAGFFMNRHINLMAAWKLSAAALLPGALVMTGGVLLYNAGWLQLAAFGGFFVAHFVIGWIYAAMSLVFVPRATGAPPKGNPFKKKR